MSEEKLLSLKAAAEYLGITEKRLKELSDHGVIPAYRVAGLYLRFKKNQLQKLKGKITNIQSQYSQYQETRSSFTRDVVYTTKDRVKDFWHFYDFYIISVVLIATILFMIFKHTL
ncbi:MAG: helix-turn-helix domain-containing protein [Candidatus Kappaea frigidicola]|nr:helix-turn-helix domain-containing protein [Candidatus Kappaea frigidicola]